MLWRTETARQEPAVGAGALGLRERSLLLMAQVRPVAALRALHGGRGVALVDARMQRGCLAPPAAATPGVVAAGTCRNLFERFDPCERMCMHRAAPLAQRLRAAPRAARDGDRDRLLAVGARRLQAITPHAGPQCAARVRERLQALLPAWKRGLPHTCLRQGAAQFSERLRRTSSIFTPPTTAVLAVDISRLKPAIS